MRYRRDTTLLPCSPADLRLAERVPFRDLPADGLLLFDYSVSHFFFEFEPKRDIELFLQHSHFAGMSAGRLVACREDLYGVAATQVVPEPVRSLAVDLGTELPPPLKETPVGKAFTMIRRGGEWRVKLTVCHCSAEGCFSQYAWVRDSLCIALFTVSWTRLVEVEWLPFRFEIHTKHNEILGDVWDNHELARVGLPSHYSLKSVRCSYGSDWVRCLDILPDDFEIIIEYENRLGQNGLVKAAIYFDAESDVDLARAIWRRFAEQRPASGV